ncbi:MAG: GNAT family N-acetyltransferase [Exiguobacterium oxidotolerans]|uniref:GNAT family N-acetyltransferase n=1 Tax=unclassified Exiguobacterium TaxID=2644629 RepID=UPI000B58C699|nr:MULTISPECIES: GNAT family N-acetyltransferase [unclassified Exiguobacterium]ASI34534.1 GNAT family N-acetyltransferase [Exiguobacterium sp. N4-1P]
MESERLRMRPFSQEDFDFYKELVQNELVMQYINGGVSLDETEARLWFDQQFERYEDDRQTGFLLIEKKEDEEPIGFAGLILQEVDGVEELEVGYWLKPKHWKVGYGREAAKRLMREAFERGNDRLISIIHPENHSSQKVARANGLGWEKETVFKGIPVVVYSCRLTRLFRG